MAQKRTNKMVLQVRRRGNDLDEVLLKSAWKVLTEIGYEKFTFEAVAEEAKTSRTVIYRRWNEKTDLIKNVLERFWLSQKIEIPDTGKLRSDVIQLLQEIGRSRSWMTMRLNIQLVTYFHETGTTMRDFRSSIHGKAALSPCQVLVARAISRGEVADIPRSQRMIDLPLDLLRHEVLMTMKPVSKKILLQIVDELWLPLLSQRKSGKSSRAEPHISRSRASRR